ncbi:MAG: DsrE/DsrF/DrsH-like family protein [Acidimicrobiia bacterium]|nr:MAG: DsrE/DsrF/DrsH-like family protein [Acidimicrobiia bacterium]
MTTMETDSQARPAFLEDSGSRKLCLICSKGTLDMAYPGMVLANAALMEGIETNIFFTFWGLDMVVEKRMDHLKATPVGNTAMHMPQSLGPLPGMTAMATRMMKKQIADLGFPGVREFLQTIVDAGGHLWACKMSADMMKVEEADLFDGVEGIIGATEFIEMSDGAQVIFI